MKNLFITLEELDTITKLDEDFDSSSLELDEIPIEDGRVKLKVTKGEIIVVEGQISFTASLICSRCGQRFLKRFDQPFHREFIFGRDPYYSLPQVRLRDSDLDRVYFQDIGIDLRAAIREAVLTTIPMAPHCREDCKGLCPFCGQDLNIKPCSCPEEGEGGWLEEFLKDKPVH